MTHDWSRWHSGLYLYDGRHLPLYDNALCSVRKKAVCPCICFSFDSILIKCVDKETATYFVKACEKSIMRQSAWCSLSLFLVMSLNSTSWASNDNCFLNPSCILLRMLFDLHAVWCGWWLVTIPFIILQVSDTGLSLMASNRSTSDS